MNGRFDEGILGEPILWPDSQFESAQADYEELVIRVRDDLKKRKVIRCLGYIGFQIVGFWDETIIESGQLYSAHAFLTRCEKRVKELPATGSETRVATGNRLLEITFIDGCKLWVCASQLRCENSS
jgi:hypothetical protein